MRAVRTGWERLRQAVAWMGKNAEGKIVKDTEIFLRKNRLRRAVKEHTALFEPNKTGGVLGCKAAVMHGHDDGHAVPAALLQQIKEFHHPRPVKGGRQFIQQQ